MADHQGIWVVEASVVGILDADLGAAVERAAGFSAELGADHLEAPPSREVAGEMKRFIRWFNRPVESLAGLARAGVAHLYFECIHPFEDGNGRIGRAIAEMALSQDWWSWARWSARAS